MILLKQVKALPEIAPKCEKFWLVRIAPRKRLESVCCQPCGKYLDGDMPLARRVNLHAQPVDLLDPIIRDGNASDGTWMSPNFRFGPSTPDVAQIA